MPDDHDFQRLITYLSDIPGIGKKIGAGALPDGGWWVKFSIDVDHPLAWRVVQELGHVLNYISIEERLPTVFKPVSPPPYMNGGPQEFLSWVVECSDSEFTPDKCAEWLEGRLPRPVVDPAKWKVDDEPPA